jgi:hypothetical protein
MSPVIRGMKWFRKLAIKVITAALQNILILHKDVCSRKIPITKLKDEVSMKLMHIQESTESVTASSAVCCVLVNME